MTSLNAPKMINTTEKPTPIIKPSSAEGSIEFLDANASARPKMAQLVTIRGINIPRISYSS